MLFKVGERVVVPAFGLGDIVAIVNKGFAGGEKRQYYEVANGHGTIWVPVATAATAGLRAITAKSQLAHFRRVLRSDPAELERDNRQRRVDLFGRLKNGGFQDLCEVVRDLTARAAGKALGEADNQTLRRAREDLCAEWAEADGISRERAAEEIAALLAGAQKARAA